MSNASELDLDDLPNTRDAAHAVRLPTPADMPARVLALELAANARKRDSQRAHHDLDGRVAALEGLVRRLSWMVLGGSATVATACVGVGLYVGTQVATLEAALSRVERHETRIERIETKLMSDARAELEER
ncbi:hypothetical protein [Sandaracinus amylolyticus]|uniref:hypothetical protein n=1 Tax=Sandaracinus amylolyticus TaxID=927083 RepID=UPI001F3CA706|nr:hypothetical protein [Sandaracinus amylolyticus]UJR81501.1 Hypothetical protein I5071_35610 [Sandaracinus amylolyticus]